MTQTRNCQLASLSIPVICASKGSELELNGLKSLTLETALSIAEHSKAGLGISMLGLTGLPPQNDRASAPAQASMRASLSIGFVKRRLHPASRHLALSMSSACAVSAKMGCMQPFSRRICVAV